MAQLIITMPDVDLKDMVQCVAGEFGWLPNLPDGKKNPILAEDFVSAKIASWVRSVMLERKCNLAREAVEAANRVQVANLSIGVQAK